MEDIVRECMKQGWKVVLFVQEFLPTVGEEVEVAEETGERPQRRREEESCVPRKETAPGALSQGQPSDAAVGHRLPGPIAKPYCCAFQIDHGSK